MENEKNDVNSVEVNVETAVEAVEETIGLSQDPVLDTKEIKSLPKGKKSKLPIILLLLLLILLGVGEYYYYFVMNNNKNESFEKENIEKEKKKVTSSYKITSNKLESFDLFFLKNNNNEKNMVYSPLSIKNALLMLKEGTNGDSKDQIDAIIESYTKTDYVNSENLSFANALFVKDSFKNNIKSEYTESISNKYNAEVIYNPFTDAEELNNWVSNNTLGLIKNLLEDDSVKSSDYILVNALGIDMEWVNKIESLRGFSETYEYANFSIYVSPLLWGYSKLTFNNNQEALAVEIGAFANRYDIISDLGEDTIKTEVLNAYEEFKANTKSEFYEKYYGLESNDEVVERHLKGLKSYYNDNGSSTDFEYYVDDDVKVFAKDLKEYNGTQLQYIAIMPTTTSLKDYINNMTADSVNATIKKLKNLELDSYTDGYLTKITGTIPLFNYDYDLNALDSLKAMGVTDVFDNSKANLSNMTTVSGSAIDNVKQKASISFSNDGIKAVAATSASGWGQGDNIFYHKFDIPMIEIDLTFDKPFMYIIVDKNTEEVWFAGTVYQAIDYDMSYNGIDF